MGERSFGLHVARLAGSVAITNMQDSGTGAPTVFATTHWSVVLSAVDSTSATAQEAEGRYQQEPADESSPERLYERRWALTVLDRAQGNLKAEFAADRKSDLYEALKIFLSGEKAEQSQAQLAARLGKSTDAIRCA